MDNKIYLEMLAILALIGANGFFALSEFSIIASRRSKLKRMAKSGSRSATRAEKLHSRPEAFLATVQVGITFVGTLAGVFSGMTIVNSLTPYIEKIPNATISGAARSISFFLIVLAISFLSVVVGELVPKYIALSRPEKIAAAVSSPMTLFMKVTFFFVRLLSGTARGVIRLLGIKVGSEASSITEDEINIIIAEGLEKGIFDVTEQELITSVFDFSDRTARHAMTPRTEIVGVDINWPMDKALQFITENGFSRYPVYDRSLDNIIGMIYTKDVIRVMQHSALIIIRDIIRKPIFVPDSMKLNVLLGAFKKKRVHAAIVLDEYGGTAGLITLEDLLEEIVGEIQDEHDTEPREFVKRSESLAYAAGGFRVDELNDEFHTELPEDGPTTLAGLVVEHLGRPAAKGEEIVIKNLKFVVLEADGNRLKRLKIERLPQDESYSI
ncbi:MAG: hemolysin family protein [Candidatus Zixiibacteriota bacterium]